MPAKNGGGRHRPVSPVPDSRLLRVFPRGSNLQGIVREDLLNEQPDRSLRCRHIRSFPVPYHRRRSAEVSPVPDREGQREHPLPDGDEWKHPIDEPGGRVGHATPAAGGAEPASLARECDEVVASRSNAADPVPACKAKPGPFRCLNPAPPLKAFRCPDSGIGRRAPISLSSPGSEAAGKKLCGEVVEWLITTAC
jgi:hypothetical protein